MDRDETVGDRIKRLRDRQGMSQRDLSSPGVSYAYISRLEAGARTPSVKALRKLAEKLGVSVQYLETGSEDPLDTGCAEAGISWRELTEAERSRVRAAADAWARYGAYEATRLVLRAREEAKLAELEAEADVIRQRRVALA